MSAVITTWIQYRLNGIILPEGISVFGQTLSPRLISSLKLITGVSLQWNTDYGTAGYRSTSPPSGGAIEPGGSVSMYGGSHGTIEPSFDYGNSIGTFRRFRLSRRLHAQRPRVSSSFPMAGQIRCTTARRSITASDISRIFRTRTIA